MDAQAVAQARTRLAKAEKSSAALKIATTIEDAEKAWTDFLVAAGAVYSKLEQGAKANGRSLAWFGKKKRERKTDPLLRYLHFARNSSEHGIERVSAATADNVDLNGRKLAFNERRPYKIEAIDQVTFLPTGKAMDCVMAGPTLKPVQVTDSRFGDSCDPPTTHMGDEIPYAANFLDSIAEAAIPYL
jgi:hypothetical protein